MDIEAHADNLAALMVLDRGLEPTPEPFRMQGDVWVHVDYSQYLAFIRSLPEESQLLYNPTVVLKEAMEHRNDTALLKAFYTDMACAVGKELFFAEAKHKPATHIRHSFGSCTATKHVVVTETAVRALQSILYTHGFSVSVPSAANLKDWSYACKLLQEALNGPTRWVEK